MYIRTVVLPLIYEAILWRALGLLKVAIVFDRWRTDDGTGTAVTTVASLENRKDPVISFWMA